MKVATRDVLAELLLAALDDAATAATVCGLAAAARTGAAGVQQRAFAEKLRSVPPSDFEAEWPAIRTKLIQYGAVLEDWSGQAGGSALEVALRKSVLLFNHQLFFEVHEVLEPEWMKEQGAIKIFLQGLIQIAVAFHHLGRGNLAGARSLLHEGLIKIAPHAPACLGLELQDFIAGLENCRQVIAGLSPETWQQFSADAIPRLRLVA